MSFFESILPIKKISTELDEVKALLKEEKKFRIRQAKKAEAAAKILKLELAEAKAAEKERLQAQQKVNKKQAIVHLKAAERYHEQMELATGSRVSELKAIVDVRVEKAKHLGFALTGSITKTITKLS